MKHSLPIAVLLGLVTIISPAAAQSTTPATPLPSPPLRIGHSEGSIVTRASDSVTQATAEPAPDDASGRITLNDFEQMALANNPTLRQAEARVRALRGKQLQVGLYPNPVLGYIGDEIGDEGTAGQQGAFFGQQLVTSGKLALSRSAAGQEVSQAEYAVQSQRWRVLNDLRIAGYEVLVAQRNIELGGRLVEIGEVGVKATESLVRAKEIGRVDFLQARVELNAAMLHLDASRNQYLTAWRKLAAMAGSPTMEPQLLVDELEKEMPVLSWGESLANILAESPEVAHARAGVERARCELARECAERIPNLDLEGGVRYSNASRSTVALFQVGVPLQLHNRNQGNIAKAQAELSAAASEVDRVELAIQTRLAEAFGRYLIASQQVRRYRDEILGDTKASLDLVRTGYAYGQFNYLDWLTAQRTYFRVNLSYVDSLRELWISRVEIEGMLVTGALQMASP